MSDNHQNGQERPDAEKPSSPGAAAGGTGGGNGNGTREPPNGGRARYGRGAQQIQTAIDRATEFLKQTYPVGKDGNNQDDLSVYRIIPNCLGGTLCLIEYKWAFDQDYYDCCVVIRGDEEPTKYTTAYLM